MKLLIRVVIQSEKNNGQFVQRQKVHHEFDLPKDEHILGAFLDIATPVDGGYVSLIQK